MREMQCTTWEEFEAHALDEIASGQRISQDDDGLGWSQLLFRGHADSSWSLATTLDRYMDNTKARGKECSEEAYHLLMRELSTYCRSLTQNNFYVGEYVYHDIGPPAAYEFMIYLRHHGFPSPLLDWTESPYVAAFFAFETTQAQDVAIYSFREFAGGAKGFEVGAPHIVSLGPTVITHRRHFLQQCQYTICVLEREEAVNKAGIYCKYDSIAREDAAQDVVVKYILPAGERKKALSRLQMMNINVFSLFENEEGLVRSLTFRVLDKFLNDGR